MRRLLFLLFIFLSCSTFAQNDSAYFAGLLQQPVWRYTMQKDSNIVWVIAGEIPNKVYRIKKNKIKDITEKVCLPEKNLYTDIVYLGNRHTLLATSNNYMFYLRGTKKYKWLNQQYGVKDSCIHSFDLRKDKKMVFASSENSRYLLKNYNRYYHLYFKQITDSDKTIDELAYFFKYYIQEPVQKGICLIASDVEFTFSKEKMITDKKLKKIRQELSPGDIIIKRNDYQLANVGIPGFWTHSGIFIGSLSTMDSCFANLPILEGTKPSDYIRENYPAIYQAMLNKEYLIIEAIGKGVVINHVEHIAKVDYLAALRPNLDKCNIFQSILSAFDYYGTPYDYLFDFQNDDAMVCSELVYHAYKPTPEKKGINFIMGSYKEQEFLSPNDIARHYALEYTKPNPQLKLVYFYDADRIRLRSVRRDEHAFSKTWEKKK